MAIKSRIFNIMQYEKHPETGDVLLTEDAIKLGLNHKMIKRYAYAYHDKDVYSQADEEADPSHKQGDIKPPHWHIVLELVRQIDCINVAKWFDIPMNFVNIAKGAGAFLDCVEYLTHEDNKQQGLGKHLYPDDEIKVNFDFRKELVKRAERRMKYGKDLTDKQSIRNDVLFGGRTLRQIMTENPLAYQEDFQYLEKCRLRYISTIAEMPKQRINYYIEGAGGIGKGLISRAIARALTNATPEQFDDEIFFEIGSDNASFEGYDGQPVIIWNDCRSFTLLQKLGGRENVFNVFDPFPPSIKQNVKYSSIRLNNVINIVNSVETWSKFLNGLAGEYTDRCGVEHKCEDKSQSYRRFPFFVVLHEDDYTLGMNKGLFEGTREFEQFMFYNGLRGNMRKIADSCGDNVELYNIVAGKAITPVKEKYVEMKDKLVHHQKGTDAEILAEFADVGTQDPTKING